MSLVNLQDLKLLPQKLKSVPFIEHLDKFHLDLYILRYSNSPQVSCLGMNPGRGWNHDLEESYLLEYSEFDAETFTKGTSVFHLRPVKISVHDTSSILRYRECTKISRFSILGFFRPRVKLMFDFPRVLLNQKI